VWFGEWERGVASGEWRVGRYESHFVLNSNLYFLFKEFVRLIPFTLTPVI
jgi:hypothetical protein